MRKPTLTQNQCEAIADILVVAMYADGHISLLEDENLNEKIDALGWDENQSPSFYLNLSIAKSRAADTLDKAKSILEDRSAILETQEIKDYTYRKTIDLLQSDGLTDEEKEFIVVLRSALNQ
ncbi:MAG: hypothetical protein AAF571_15775 [Verrucomicrobiota bacterium]